MIGLVGENVVQTPAIILLSSLRCTKIDVAGAKPSRDGSIISEIGRRAIRLAEVGERQSDGEAKCRVRLEINGFRSTVAKPP